MWAVPPDTFLFTASAKLTPAQRPGTGGRWEDSHSRFGKVEVKMQSQKKKAVLFNFWEVTVPWSPNHVLQKLEELHNLPG